MLFYLFYQNSNNNELMPSSSYYYKFKDYAPWVFRSIREICKIDTADYLVKICILILFCF